MSATAEQDGFVPGDVVRWVVAGKYTFAALYTADRWWLTGKGAAYEGVTDMDHEQFSRILEFKDVSDIVVSSGWEPLES